MAPLIALIFDALHILDIYTDLSLARMLYQFSREEKFDSEGNSQNHYNVCFVFVVLATMGPFIIQYSTQMLMMYNKGHYNWGRFRLFGTAKQLCLIV